MNKAQILHLVCVLLWGAGALWTYKWLCDHWQTKMKNLAGLKFDDDNAGNMLVGEFFETSMGYWSGWPLTVSILAGWFFAPILITTGIRERENA